MQNNFTENSNALFEKLEKFFTSKTVVGETIIVGEVTLIPMINISFGLGTGAGDGTDEKGNKGVGGGGGVGAKATPTAVITITNGKVEILPINNRGGLEKLLEMVPDIVDRVNLSKDENKNQEG